MCPKSSFLQHLTIWNYDKLIITKLTFQSTDVVGPEPGLLSQADVLCVGVKRHGEDSRINYL